MQQKLVYAALALPLRKFVLNFDFGDNTDAYSTLQYMLVILSQPLSAPRAGGTQHLADFFSFSFSFFLHSIRLSIHAYTP